MGTRRSTKGRLLLEELEGRVVPSASTLTSSSNWSGYAVTAARGAVTSVTGSWTVPTIAAGQGTAYSAQWVGIDGFTSSTVEQIGTEADLIQGVPQYYAWYEMYPKGYVTLPLTIHQQDAIAATVSSVGGNSFVLSITNITTGQSFSTTQVMAHAQLSSAEWIVEAPSSAHVLPLANFGTVTFSGATATIAGTHGPIDNSTWASAVNQVNLVASRTNPTTATSSTLTDLGAPLTSSFAVTSSAPILSGSNHQGQTPNKTTNQVVFVTTVSSFALTSYVTNTNHVGNTILLYVPQNSSTQYQPPAGYRLVTSVDLGHGVRPVSVYFFSTGNEQAMEEVEDEGDVPALRTPAPTTEPAQPQRDAVPPQNRTPQAPDDQISWMEAVAPVFAHDFAASEEEMIAQPLHAGLQEYEPRCLLEALVVTGAILAFQPREDPSKIQWPEARGKRRSRVLG